MSGLALIFNRDGSKPQTSELAGMMQRLSSRAIDGSRSITAGPLALGYASFWTTPEEVGEHQPLIDQRQRNRIVFDGRIDNRSELGEALGLDPSAATSDAEMALRAFEKWRENSFERIVGSFAVIIYDALRRCVVLARSGLGGRGLVYHLDTGKIVAASEEQAVLAHPGVADNWNPTRWAQFFAALEPNPDSTFFSQVKTLPPGHFLVVDDRRSMLERWWRLPPPTPGPSRSRMEHAERFRELLTESVRCRLRAIHRPALMMSGGLDSTSIAAVASGLLSDSVRSSLHTYTWAFDRFPCDESRLARATARCCGLTSHFLQSDDSWPLQSIESSLGNPNTPERNPYRVLHELTNRASAEAGRRLLFSGIFGDQLFTGVQSWFFDLLRRRQVSEALGEVWVLAQQAGICRAIYRSAVAPFVGNLKSRFVRMPPWLTGSAKEYLATGHTTRQTYGLRPGQMSSVLSPLVAHGVACESWYSHRSGIELRLPYRDERLVAFLLGVPTGELFRVGYRRPIVRRAMRRLLPDSIRCRQDKTSFESLFRFGVETKSRQLVTDIVEDKNAVWRHFVDHKWLSRAWYSPTQLSREALYVLWLCICCELWWRSAKGGTD